MGIRFRMYLKLHHVMLVEFSTMLFKHGYVSRTSSQASTALLMSELKLLKLRLANFSLGMMCSILNI